MRPCSAVTPSRPQLPPLQEAALLLLGGLSFRMEAILRLLLRSAVEPRLSESVRAAP